MLPKKAIALLEGHAGADGLRTIAAPVAASALREDDRLVTANQKHFN